MWHLQVEMRPNKSVLESSSIVNLMISNELSQNMEELFKLNEKYSEMYATIARDAAKLLNIIEIYVFFSYIIWLFSIFNSANEYP